MDRQHSYSVQITWTGNTGTGTSDYRDYQRANDISSEGKPQIPGSSDPAFRGDRTRWSPEDLLVASLSACHQLWYLHLCADAGIVVVSYEDKAEGVMEETPEGGGRFTSITLRPLVSIAKGSDTQLAIALHETAHAHCFIANSINFPVTCKPMIVEQS